MDGQEPVSRSAFNTGTKNSDEQLSATLRIPAFDGMTVFKKQDLGIIGPCLNTR